MQIVASDLDGTLLKSDRSISERTLRILEKLAANHIVFVVATARAYRNAHNLFPLDFDNLYLICYNGAEVYHKTKLIRHNYLEANQVKNMVDWFLEHDPDMRISLEISNHLYTNFDITTMPGWIPPYTQVDFKTFEPQPAAKMLVDLRDVSDLARINEGLPKNCSIVITDRGILGQIAQKDVSKMNAIQNLSKSLGSGVKEIIAFGDDFNDLEMIRTCGIGIAMGNAPQAVKDAADIITLTNDEEGVAVELERIFKDRF